MPADRGERTPRTKGAGRSDDETARSAERSDHQDDQEGQDDQEDKTDGTTDGLDVLAAVRVGRRLIAAVTNREPEGVTSVEPTEAGWTIGVEVLEDRHIPSSSDVLALYEVEVDSAGTLLSYRRTQRYTRGRGNGVRRGEGS